MYTPACFFPLILVLALLLSACSSIEYSPDKAPRMLVLHDGTPFFLHGPAQGNGADLTLAKGDEVQVFRKEFGYSFVQLKDGQKGFVANEELVIAPPMPSPTPIPQSTSAPDHLSEERVFPDSGIPAENTNAPLTIPGFRY